MNRNIFDVSNLDFSKNEEVAEILASSEQVRIERIVSFGQTTNENFWYDQNENEFVTVLQGEAKIRFDNGKEKHLVAGDYLIIPAGVRHQVTYTSISPACIWLTVFYSNK